ncbi:MAG TPA: hypothetical protein PKH33_18555 [bacterium]|nr:hypothetical protein [bacterium]
MESSESARHVVEQPGEDPYQPGAEQADREQQRATAALASPHKPISAKKGKNLFKCDDILFFDGNVDKRRTYICVNDQQFSIPNREFEIILMLAVQLKKDGKGWVRSDRIAADNAWQLVSRARKCLQVYLKDKNGEIIENNYGGSYRLSVPPDNVSFDIETLQEHWHKSIAELVGKITKTTTQ